MRYAFELYPHPNSGDPCFDPKPASDEELEAHFAKWLDRPNLDDEFTFEQFQGELTQEELAAIGKKLLNNYQFDKSEYFG